MGVAFRALFVAIALVAVASCAGATGIGQTTAAPADSVLALLDRGIAQLSANMTGLDKRIHDLEQMDTGSDPIMRELRALDLAGWQLHRQQWALQHDHLVFARDQLQRAQQNSEDKPRLLAQWQQHEQEYRKALEDLHQQRQALEQKHIDVEARLIEQRLR